MVKPETPRARARRQQILTAARTLFLTQGYARTSTDAVTQAAGVSKQTLYAYYRGKAELLSATVAQELGDLDLGGRPWPAPTPREELRARVTDFAQTVTTRLLHPDALALLRLLVGEAVHLPELRTALRQALPARLLSVTEQLLREAHNRGIIHAPDPALSARLLVGPVMSFVVLDGLFGDTAPSPPDQATLTQLVNLFLCTVTREGDPT